MGTRAVEMVGVVAGGSDGGQRRGGEGCEGVRRERASMAAKGEVEEVDTVCAAPADFIVLVIGFAPLSSLGHTQFVCCLYTMRLFCAECEKPCEPWACPPNPPLRHTRFFYHFAFACYFAIKDINYSSGFQAVIGRTVTPALAPWPSISIVADYLKISLVGPAASFLGGERPAQKTTAVSAPRAPGRRRTTLVRLAARTGR
eukprot:scaffold1140_cov115-Isochrysis_galbana.AAC.1